MGEPSHLAEARAAAYAMPLDRINPGNPKLFQADTLWPYFERLRKEDPVHWTVSSSPRIGGFWSVTRYEDIVAVDSNHQDFSSQPSILLADPAEDMPLPMFIAMDPPRHGEQRKTVSPAMGIQGLTRLAPIIRERAGAILDDLPIGVEFDWVDRVSIELTTMTLATLFDFPWADRRKLTRWSDVATAQGNSGAVGSEDQRRAEIQDCGAYFINLWNERIAAPPAPDLISMLAHGEHTRHMSRAEYLGNLILLIVGGADTTRNTITGSVLALNQNPDQYEKLRKFPELIPSMVSETIRWQTPLAYMARRAVRDVELGGKTIRAGDKVAMWYVSGNRDETVIPRPDDYWIDRPDVRRHLSFGFGIHRCLGARLAELQLQIIWEEILKRFPHVQVTGPPRRVYSSFVKGYESLPVIIPAMA